MRKYEAMCIVKPTLSEDERKTVFAQINEAVTKLGGSIAKAGVWAERRKLFFPINKHQEGVYYLVNFSADPSVIAQLKRAYKLNENILRALITVG